MKRIPFSRGPITHKFKRPHSKAEEPDCLFRRYPPSIMITTQSQRGGEGGLSIFIVRGSRPRHEKLVGIFLQFAGDLFEGRSDLDLKKGLIHHGHP